MQKNSHDFSMQEALRLAETPAGQRLLAILMQSDPDKLSAAAKQFSNGDSAGAARTLRDFLELPEVKRLVSSIGGQNHE